MPNQSTRKANKKKQTAAQAERNNAHVVGASFAPSTPAPAPTAGPAPLPAPVGAPATAAAAPVSSAPTPRHDSSSSVEASLSSLSLHSRDTSASSEVSVPSAPPQQTPAQPKHPKGPLFFCGPDGRDGFMDPESTEPGKLQVNKDIQKEFLTFLDKLPDPNNKGPKKFLPLEPQVPGAGCFYTLEHMLLVMKGVADHCNHYGTDGYSMHAMLNRGKHRRELLKCARGFFDDLQPNEDDDSAGNSVVRSWEVGNVRLYAVNKYWEDDDAVAGTGCAVKMEDIVRMGVFLAFCKSHNSLQQLLKLKKTAGFELVYAHPTDRALGIGFGKEQEREVRGNRSKWGRNFLGVAFMELRDGVIVKDGVERGRLEVLIEEEEAKAEARMEEKRQQEEALKGMTEKQKTEYLQVW